MNSWAISPAAGVHDGKYLRIADPIFPIRISAISFALVLSRAMNSWIIVVNRSMIPDILRRLVDFRNSGNPGNFNGNGAFNTICLSDIKRARHGRGQMLVLRGDLIKKSGWWVGGAAKIFKEQTSAIRTKISVLLLLHWCMDALQVMPDFMGTMGSRFFEE